MDPASPKAGDAASNLGRPIYTAPAPMVNLIKMIKRLSISTTLLSAGIQPFLYPKLVAAGALTTGIATFTCAGIFISPLILNWFTKRYVTQLYYNDDTDRFTAKRLNLINRPISLTYKAEEVKVPEALGIFTTYTVGTKKQPLFVDPNLVVDFDAYRRMLGFDKPIDMRREELAQIIEKLKKGKNETKDE